MTQVLSKMSERRSHKLRNPPNFIDARVTGEVTAWCAPAAAEQFSIIIFSPAGGAEDSPSGSSEFGSQG